MIRGIDRAHDIDLGPSSGMHTKGGVFGVIVRPVPASKPPSHSAEGRRAYRASRWTPPLERQLCGVWMPRSRDYCARSLGHANFGTRADHRTRSALDKIAARRHFDPTSDV